MEILVKTVENLVEKGGGGGGGGHETWLESLMGMRFSTIRKLYKQAAHQHQLLRAVTSLSYFEY